ncbi:hypothetical protein EYF80_048489 [Liparis tanakae]|uniref:Uncharacterized protein n=1 Tax=Liparis tanakae TaxID=230148 RepID=A0A4Z2FKD1_9TELE|nr:hypothetical protein EYF80_048489 [Liparis tanakae]
MCPALPERPWVHSGGASRLGKNARGVERPGFGSGLAIVPREKQNAAEGQDKTAYLQENSPPGCGDDSDPRDDSGNANVDVT